MNALAHVAHDAVDKLTSRRGTFLHRGDFRAISPVCSDLVSLFDWACENGYPVEVIETGSLASGLGCEPVVAISR